MSLIEPGWHGTPSVSKGGAEAEPQAAPASAPSLSWLALATIDLEAPAVALVWQVLFARALATWSPSELAARQVSLAHALLLGIPVWLVYVADRTADSLRDRQLARRTRRHRIHLLLRRPLAAVWAILLTAALIIAIATLSGRQWLAPATLATAALLYFLLVQHPGPAGHWFRSRPGPKEAAIGLLFAGGVWVFPWTNAVAAGQAPDLMRPFLALGSFALLCSCNCLLIRLCELPPGAATLRRATRRLLWIQTAMTMAIAVLLLAPSLLALAIPGLDRSALSQTVLWPAAILLSLFGLLIVWQRSRDLSAEEVRLMADLSLILPILFLFLFLR